MENVEQLQSGMSHGSCGHCGKRKRNLRSISNSWGYRYVVLAIQQFARFIRYGFSSE